ncbi:MAG: division/cell wall cluster transcriptional repressor MraZ, partial [Butyrivibrio sp.]|nr:division/cell wall cluster transcriptional repressor MraZ [Butyrivibrio sp.]
MRSRFRGNYSHAIDTKGRIIIPVRFREALGDTFVVTKGFDGCLYAFAQDDWDVFEEKLDDLSLINPD